MLLAGAGRWLPGWWGDVAAACRRCLSRRGCGELRDADRVGEGPGPLSAWLIREGVGR